MLHVTANDVDDVIASLENAPNTLFKWFNDNPFKATPINVT